MKRSPWIELLREAVAALEAWEAGWPEHPLAPPADAEVEAIDALAARLRDNYPFFHPRYAGQLLKPPHHVAWVAHALTSLVNPNNHASDGGPATAALEREAVGALAAMVGYDGGPGSFLGHLCASGTIGNLEALWVARQSHPGRAVAYGRSAHYTHARMLEVLGVEGRPLPVDDGGHLDLEALERCLAAGGVGTVVVTLGTTGLGVLDDLDRVLPIARAHGARVHVDAAYGGFFALLARRDPPLVRAAPFAALGGADSIVVDPHKHGLQPYGCGCVLFRDPHVGRFYQHDSPYTYFTSADSDLHLGEISLECSRAGASAAALWATLRAIPLRPEVGLGALLAAGRRAALAWADAIAASRCLRLVIEPETDIVCFAPVPAPGAAASAISRWSEALFERAMAAGSEGVYLAKYRVERDFLAGRWRDLRWDRDEVVVLRSVLMKPEHETFWPTIHAVVEGIAAELQRDPAP